MRSVWAEVNISAIKKNVALIKERLAPGVLFMAVVKANGYGHGDTEVSKAALGAGADRLGVALVEEGIKLREAGIGCPIQILGEIAPSSTKLVIENNLIPTICSRRVVEKLSEEAKKANMRLKVHVKIDTGMHRLGVSPEEALGFLNYVKSLSFIEVEGIFTHFAMAGESTEYTKKQFKSFLSVISNLKEEGFDIPLKHAANSAATILMPETYLNMVRVGISMYGLYPTKATKQAITLNPTLQLKTRVSSVRTISSGEGVSYGLTYRAKEKTGIAVLPLGYADGYSRLFSNKSFVLLKGKRFSVVGNVCMDQFMIDVGDCQVEPGDEAILIGSQGGDEITADELAEILGTINYEVVCMISGRVPRIYLNES